MASIACVVVRRLPCIASGKQARVSVLVVGRIDGQHDVVLAEREEPLARVHAQHREGLASGARTLDGVLHVARALFGPVAQQRCTWPCQPPLHRTINLPNCGTLRGAYETNPVKRISVRGSSATAPSAATPASQYTASQPRRRAQPPACECGPAAISSTRPRASPCPAALPELRRRTRDQRGHSRIGGDRSDPHASGSAGLGAVASRWARRQALSGSTGRCGPQRPQRKRQVRCAAVQWAGKRAFETPIHQAAIIFMSRIRELQSLPPATTLHAVMSPPSIRGSVLARLHHESRLCN